MIRKFLSFLSLACSVVLFSCSSGGNDADTPSASISATIDGQSWRSLSNGAIASLNTIDVDGESKTVLTIVGMKTDQSTVSIQFPVENITEGTYNFSAEDETGSLSYTTSMLEMYTSSETGGSFTVTITDLNYDSGRISGTFSGTLKDFEGNTLSVTEGRMNSIMIMNSNVHSNGTMSLSKNGGTVFSMDSSTDDGKHIMIIENSEAENVSVFGYNSTISSDAGVYNLTFPKNVTPGTYNLASDTEFTAGIGNGDNEPEYNLTSGTITITAHSGNTVSGTFNYTVNNGVQTVNITNGSFSITHN